MDNEIFLSPSRIKLAKGCRWKYWCRYHLNLPEKSNDGARRGHICHTVLEVLGKKTGRRKYDAKRRSHFNRIIKGGTIKQSKAVTKLVRKLAKKTGVHDTENLKLIDEMIVAGLSYDFFGTKIGRPTSSISERKFEIKKNQNGIRYNIRGILDKIYIYKGKKFAIFRDFKTSKEVFKGKEVTDNFQHWMYSLATRVEYPEVDNIRSEFIFLRHKDKHSINKEHPYVIKMDDIDDEALDGFEHELTAYQTYFENFSESDARSGFAAHMPFPKDGSFSGRLECGFAKEKGQLKKDGTPMWHCPYKFDFYYYIIYDKDDKVVSTCFINEFQRSMVPKGGSYKKAWYAGCPVFQKKD